MITGRCLCGDTRFAADGVMLWAAACHCRDCQRASGADYVSWFGLRTESVRWSGPRRAYTSSAGVTRSFCGTCGTPMSFEAQRFPGETHFYAPTLDDLSLYRPGGHVHWSERVPWLEDLGGLQKHLHSGDAPTD